MPSNIIELRRSGRAVEDAMYGDQVAPEIAQIFRDDAEHLVDVDPKVLEAVKLETSRMAADIGLDRLDVESFATAARQMRTNPPSAEQVTGMQKAYQATKDPAYVPTEDNLRRYYLSAHGLSGR